MTDEEFVLHIAGTINTIRSEFNDTVDSLMNQVASRLNEQSQAISPEYIAQLEKRISDLETK
jgi:uncharacterized coiled-coil DUF342 family protein